MRRLNRWRNPPGVHGRLRKRGLFVGTLRNSGEAVRLAFEALATHIELQGSTGSGKTRMLTWLLSSLVRVPRATIIFFCPKGSWGCDVRDWIIAHGMAKRLLWFDPGDPDFVPGWDPLWPNGLPVATHAKAMREAIRSAWGQTNFDQTAQMARFLFLSLVVARERSLGLVEALTVMSPGSPLRRRILPEIADPFVREALTRFDEMPLSRQEEIGASTVARLESFVLDSAIRNILTRRDRSLRMAEVVRQGGRIIGINTPIYNPLRPDDVKLLDRLMLNDILSVVFARAKEQRTPVFLIADEAHISVATDDLALALEAGRELQLFCALAVQHSEQWRTEGSERLYHAVRVCARTKMIFGGLSAEQLEQLTKELTIDQYNPKSVKDELTSLEIEPIEAVRVVRTFSQSQGTSRGHSVGHGTATSQGITHSEFRAYGVARGRSETVSTAHMTGSSVAVGTGQVLMPDGQVISGSSHEGLGVSSATTQGHAATTSESESTQEGTSDAQTSQKQESTNEAESSGESESSGMAVSYVPWNSHLKRRIVSSRTFWTEQEFLTEQLKLLKAQDQAEYFLKPPTGAGVFMRAPYVRDPGIGPVKRNAGMELVHVEPIYTPRAEIAEQERKALLEAAATAEPRVVRRSSQRVAGVKLGKPYIPKKRME